MGINNEVQVSSRNRCVSRRVGAWIAFVSACVFIIITVAIVMSKNNNAIKFKCNVQFSDPNSARHYPNATSHVYMISFDQKIMQARWVAYIQPAVRNSCARCRYFRIDPYGINLLRDADYTNTKYDRGHLVPNADFGYDTYIISNVVPMNPIFNQKAWAASEIEIRNSYPGKLIIKGCDYTEQHITTPSGTVLYIPAGCYYSVFNSRDVNNLGNLELLDYGYFENIPIPYMIRRLPSWVVCH